MNRFEIYPSISITRESVRHQYVHRNNSKRGIAKRTIACDKATNFCGTRTQVSLVRKCQRLFSVHFRMEHALCDATRTAASVQILSARLTGPKPFAPVKPSRPLARDEKENQRFVVFRWSPILIFRCEWLRQRLIAVCATSLFLHSDPVYWPLVATAVAPMASSSINFTPIVNVRGHCQYSRYLQFSKFRYTRGIFPSFF